LDGDSAEYFCNIMRFTIQTGNTLPVFIPSVVIGQDNPNKTIYAVSLKYTYQGIEYVSTKNVMYEPEDKTAPIPAPPLLKQDFSSKYYYVYNYTHFVQLLNATLELAFAELSDKMPGTSDASPLNATVAPCLDFDVQTNRVVFHAEQFFYDEAYTRLSSVNRVSIYFNTRLYDLLVGIPYELESNTGELNYRLKVIYNNSNLVSKNVLVPGIPTATIRNITYVQMPQEVSSIALWNPVASLVFASALLPIHPTQTSLPKNVGNSNTAFSESGNNSNLLSAISDFTIAVDGNNQYRPVVVYNPTPEYRLIDMHSCMNLNRLDIVVYWKDTFGNIRPFELHPGCSANVKIMFRRKDFNTNN
jgi:hypothetical protein